MVKRKSIGLDLAISVINRYRVGTMAHKRDLVPPVVQMFTQFFDESGQIKIPCVNENVQFRRFHCPLVKLPMQGTLPF